MYQCSAIFLLNRFLAYLSWLEKEIRQIYCREAHSNSGRSNGVGCGLTLTKDFLNDTHFDFI